MVKKLIAREFVATKEAAVRLTNAVNEGEWRYSYFEDPETGKFYRANDGFTITGDDIEDLFTEI